MEGGPWVTAVVGGPLVWWVVVVTVGRVVPVVWPGGAVRGGLVPGAARPVDTVRVTVEPLSTMVPAPGVWESTVPTATVSLVCSTRFGTNPALTKTASASGWFRLTTSGTATFSVREIVSKISVPFSAVESAAGC